MAKLQQIFVASILAVQISEQFAREVLEGGDVVLFRRRKNAPSAAGPVHVETRILKLVARDQAEAHRHALRTAREIFPEAQGWSAHASHEIEIIRNVQTFKKGFG